MQYNATTATTDVMSKFDYLQKFKPTYYFPSKTIKRFWQRCFANRIDFRNHGKVIQGIIYESDDSVFCYVIFIIRSGLISFCTPLGLLALMIGQSTLPLKYTPYN